MKGVVEFQAGLGHNANRIHVSEPIRGRRIDLARLITNVVETMSTVD